MDAPVVVITGASSGIGEATARLLAAQGARLVLGARRADRLAALAAELGGDVRTLATDVRSRADVAALVDLAVTAFGRLDVVVANAGAAHVGPLDEQPVEAWDEMIDVNLRGVLHAVAAALPVFRAQSAGHLISIVSTSGLRIVPDQVVYAATKNAVRTLCEGLRQEAGPHLRVTAISPGFTATEFVDAVPDPTRRREYREQMDRIAMPPDAIARAVAYAMAQPPTVDVGEIVVRPTAQN
ncbi:SDR family oxidoreductase [Actinomycetospora sp. CA-084318]|uniref:SDR family oxidoreductase n=1 Tax=Actinomycetospora sp. CA-084318 TaxID=3239892 RepID=UPI003D964B6A